uniref:WRKY transcription factor n=1 Tax=Withania somnifera TaxID=126910 RepID=A0A220QM81_9SOLA|nr:WRKY transcription factor [Withania somnifera]
MERVKGLEKKKLIPELTQGKELVNQLKKRLGPLASPEECDFLLGKILSKLEKSLSILNLKALLHEGGINTNNSTSSCSSISFLGNNNNNNSPKTEELDKNMVSKKRKKTPQWTNQISISWTGFEDPHQDGYSWRKYGQKDILGANHPRAYYRCTHRHTQGCLATKQVQQSDGNSFLEVTYKGRHTCKVVQSEIFSLNNQKRQKHNKKQEKEIVIVNSAPNYRVENFSFTPKEEVLTPFSFPPTPLNLENIEETKLFSDSMAPFSSPIASELPSYMSLLMPQDEQLGMDDMILQSSDSDLTELISTPTSISNSSFGGDWDNLSVDFEPNVTFDIEEIFHLI